MTDKKDEALKLALEGAANYIDALGGDGSKYRQALAEQPAQQEPVLCINPKVIDPATGKVRNGTGALTYSDEPCAGWAMPLYEHPPAQQQEPVAVFDEQLGRPKMLSNAPMLTHGQGLYTSPPASKPWVGLTADEVWQSNEVMALNAEMGLPMNQIMALIAWADAKLREKNT